MTRTILGVDPGLNITGYAALDADGNSMTIREAGIIKSTKSESFGKRLQQLHDGLSEVIDVCSPDSIAIEELYSHYKRPRTAILMGHARGIFCLAAAQKDVPLFHYSATQIKKVLTGNGRAPKDQMQLAVMRHFSLNEPPDPHDIADAMAIGICHHFLSRQTAMIE